MQVLYKKGIAPFLFFFITLLVLSSSVFAKVDIPTQNILGDDVLSITYPKYEYVPQNEAFELEVKVFNRSNGRIMIGTSTDCFLHIHSTGGKLKVDTEFTYNLTTKDFTTYIPASNFNDLGIYSFTIWCNTTYNGGFVDGIFEVTKNGLSGEETNPKEQFVVWLVLGLGMLLLIVGFWTKDVNISSLASIIIMVGGVWILIGGVVGLSNIVTIALGSICIGLGAYIWIGLNISNWDF